MEEMIGTVANVVETVNDVTEATDVVSNTADCVEAIATTAETVEKVSTLAKIGTGLAIGAAGFGALWLLCKGANSLYCKAFRPMEVKVKTAACEAVVKHAAKKAAKKAVKVTEDEKAEAVPVEGTVEEPKKK